MKDNLDTDALDNAQVRVIRQIQETFNDKEIDGDTLVKLKDMVQGLNHEELYVLIRAFGAVCMADLFGSPIVVTLVALDD